MKNTLRGINGRLDVAEGKIQLSNMKHIKKNQKIFRSSTELWNNFRQLNIWVIRVPTEAGEKEKIGERIMARNFPSSMETVNSTQ